MGNGLQHLNVPPALPPCCVTPKQKRIDQKIVHPEAVADILLHTGLEEILVCTSAGVSCEGIVAHNGLPPLGALLCVALSLPMRSFAAGLEDDSGQLIQAARSALESGNFERAGAMYTSVVRDLEGAGVTDDRLASSLVDLGRVRTIEGRCGEASNLILRGIRILDATPRPDSFERSEAWEAMAKAYDCQRQYSKAEQTLNRALDIERSAKSPRPNHLAELLASLGGVYQYEHKFDQAVAAFRGAQLVVDRNPKVDSDQRLLLLNNFGSLLRQMGRYSESESTFREGMAFAETATASRPELLVALEYNLASLEVTRKRFREAAGLFEKAVRLLDKGTSLPPRSAGELLRDYAACLRKLGDRGQAQVLEMRSAALLSSQPDGNGRVVVDVSQLTRPK